MRRRSPSRLLAALVASVTAVGLVTGAIALLDGRVPVLSLAVLYIVAVLTVASLFDVSWAVATAVTSALAFNYFFLPPTHTLHVRDSSNWSALGVFLVTAVVVGTLASRARSRAAEAEQRERETALLADVATELLGGATPDGDLDRLAERASPGRELPEDARRRLLPALGALLTLSREREELAGQALEAETLRRSDAVKTAVLRAVSHDFRTPLATIETALGVLESGTLVLSDADRGELMDTIRIEHARLKRLVEDLLDLSRLQAGAAHPALELWPAGSLVEQALEPLPDRARVRVVTADVLPFVRVDAVQVQRALANLLENALRVSPPGEPVTVRIDATRTELLIRVVDHGPGVPPAERERIFEAFHRLDPSGGTGLGLAIARGFVEANGGRVWVESRTDQGASFALALPAVPVPAGVTA